MLYDPKWEVKAKTPSMTGLAVWLETQKPAKRYRWSDCDGGCLIGQYFATIGMSWKEGTADLPDGKSWYGIVNGQYLPGHTIAFPAPHTFGAALKRVRAKLANAEEA